MEQRRMLSYKSTYSSGVYGFGPEGAGTLFVTACFYVVPGFVDWKSYRIKLNR